MTPIMTNALGIFNSMWLIVGLKIIPTIEIATYAHNIPIKLFSKRKKFPAEHRIVVKKDNNRIRLSGKAHSQLAFIEFSISKTMEVKYIYLIPDLLELVITIMF